MKSGDLKKMSISFRDEYTTHGVGNYYTRVASSYKNPHEPGVQKCLRQILESIVPGKSTLLEPKGRLTLIPIVQKKKK